MASAISSLSSRLIARTLIVGGLASSSLLLTSSITLAQGYYNLRNMGCDYDNTSRRPWVYAVTNWSNQPIGTSAVITVDLNKYYAPPFRYLPVISDGQTATGRNGLVSAIAISPSSDAGWFRGDVYQNASFFPEDISIKLDRFCPP